MSQDALRALVREVIIELAPRRPDDPSGDDLLLVDDLGYNSLSVLELVFALEEELDIDLMGDGAAASYITTVRNLQDHVLTLIRLDQPTAR